MKGSTTFVSRAAVDVWDAQFRWRDGRLIRDRTVDDTWRRVANAVAAIEGVAAGVWAMRFVAAFRSWRLLPDPGVLRCAGTDAHLAGQDICTATVNVRAFVRTGPDGEKLFDATSFRDTAELALRLADDGIFLWKEPIRPEPRVGLMGLSDALDALGVPCTGERAIGFCGEVAELLALGCLRGNLRLGAERGPLATRARPCSRPGLPGPASRRGMLRHPIVTRLQPQPDLAMLANGTSGTCSPAPDARCRPDTGSPEHHASVLREADTRLRRVMQPWIDETIDCEVIHRPAHPPTEASP